MEAIVVPISLPLFLIGFSTQSVYKVPIAILKGLILLLILYLDNVLLIGRSQNDLIKVRDILIFLLKSVLLDKFREISTADIQQDRVFVNSCEVQRYDTHSSTRESKCNNRSVSVASLKR